MECQVNEFIVLKLEDGNPNIYVKGVKFGQSKLLKYNLPIKRDDLFDKFRSIDEALDYLEQTELKIPQFHDHCTALQTWSKNNYDTRLLHRVVAFPLLKKLVQIGDPIAKKIFNEEITKRFKSCELSVMIYLLQAGYLKIFNKDELIDLYGGIDFNVLENQDPVKVISKLEKLIELGIEPAKNALNVYKDKELLLKPKKVRGEHKSGSIKKKIYIQKKISDFSSENNAGESNDIK